MANYSTVLVHHGIKGQKWGVRRYQNEDGSWTSAGRERYGKGGESAPKSLGNSMAGSSPVKKSSGLKKALGVAAVTAGAAGATALAVKNKDKIKQFASEKADQAKNYLKSDEFKKSISDAGKKTVNAIGDATKRVGKAMGDAALATIGTVAVAKIASKYAADSNDDEATAFQKQLILNTATAAVNSALKTSVNTSSNKSNENQQVGKEITDRLGKPSNKGIDRQGTEYQSLFKDSNGNQRDPQTRSMIKSLASNGYDADQIKQYLNDVDRGIIKHSIVWVVKRNYF